MSSSSPSPTGIPSTQSRAELGSPRNRSTERWRSPAVKSSSISCPLQQSMKPLHAPGTAPFRQLEIWPPGDTTGSRLQTSLKRQARSTSRLQPSPIAAMSRGAAFESSSARRSR
ncbi:hypothetical protein OG756_05825 [Streptomyces sp. NBC_01310]|uniref:hypothetical protein n=1 Tax=Streptomyces sp. NBC_01310 TaxID=2903820 RepID=UPI0035B69352|nr:hypothetical protein OG756_05825 [Streptomyces sp. NBC_01310]